MKNIPAKRDNIPLMPKRLSILILLTILLQACVPASASEPTPTTVLSLPTPTLTPIAPQPAPEEIQPTQVLVPPQPISRVLIVTFDGMRPDAIEAADMINVKELMQNGAYTLHAQTVYPSSTLPAHASMVTGTCPAKHIARWDEYVPQNGYALGTDIFDLTHAVGLRTVIVAGKEKIQQITEPTSLDYWGFIDETDKTKDITTLLNMGREQVKQGFGLMLMHFPNGDLAGHKYGWMSKQQLSAYHEDDKSFGALLQTMKDNGFYDGTLIIITSDHGGHETHHGTNMPDDLTIPWIIYGPQVVPGILKTQVYIMDTAPTVAFALGLPLQAEWDGAPVYEAFGLPVDPNRVSGCPGTTP